VVYIPAANKVVPLKIGRNKIVSSSFVLVVFGYHALFDLGVGQVVERALDGCYLGYEDRIFPSKITMDSKKRIHPKSITIGYLRQIFQPKPVTQVPLVVDRKALGFVVLEFGVLPPCVIIEE